MMKNHNQYFVNDIRRCVEQAYLLANNNQNIRQKERSLYRAFVSLAGDESIGLLAFTIWRSRSQLLTNLRDTSTHGNG